MDATQYATAKAAVADIKSASDWKSGIVVCLNIAMIIVATELFMAGNIALVGLAVLLSASQVMHAYLIAHECALARSLKCACERMLRQRLRVCRDIAFLFTPTGACDTSP